MRIAARVVVFALIGAAATVLVAWGFAPVRTGPPGGGGDVTKRERPWPIRVPETWPARSSANLSASAIGRSTTIMLPGERLGKTSLTVQEYGWPVRAMACELLRDPKLKGVSNLRHALRVPKRFVRKDLDVYGYVPTRPRWPGFLVDTAFWGGAAFLVWSVPGFVRRRVRRRRGRCVRCGYELKGIAVCPECGGAA